MNKLTSFCMFTGLVIGMISCKKTESAVVSKVTEDTVVIENTIPPLDTNADKEVDINTVNGVFNLENPSTVNWTANNPTSTHVGTINVSKGSLELKAGKITSATFEIDMKSILSTDLKSDDKEKLEGHLKSADFFEADKYPTAIFTLKKSLLIKGNDKTRHHITGDLKIKEVTKTIEFDAYVIVSNNGTLLTATTPSFEINRVDYGIKYKSGVINTVKDKIISDKIGMVINIRAKKA
ncbi:MAG: YceI family protein [Saprospiraceae bacterium]|uniref:YceI family protein n=1 Tax=Candidatus Brachybacter algidus TaxID=2982024 RepID=UPI001B496A40|nr:YceI family protein [Candidatus Brachybacter algidus]MBP7304675.1 YceI family protein [Saprospiraceae bacterium]MBK6448671.1 YceI family protein [Candidatus Brachybacter algidus]MBK7603583.1 YceI family protein [Candidatus Brachybacter algidus]MBK8356994.1 YceI family protein [Candidatus Brachybacter algidus]MBK8601809.1 YceI family protein [Candidatus Brachybacter algidus]